MDKGIIDILFGKLLGLYTDAEHLGKYGEKLTAQELTWVSLLGRKGKILRNIYLPKTNGETSEVDVVFVTKKGVFVFESKNYSGWIFGNEKDKNWTAKLSNNISNQFYNPIMQNKTHLKWMTNLLGKDVPLFSIIVFSERCELKKVTVLSKDVKVIKRDSTYATVKDIWDNSPDALSDEKLKEVYTKLKSLTKVDSATKKAHIENIKDKYQKKTETPAQNPDNNKKSESTEKLCPKCGSKLVLRTAKRGDNAGNTFYGCSAFPKCKYIENL